MTTRRKSTPQDEALIRDDRADPGLRAAAIQNVAADALEHLEDDIARLLDHDEELVRGQALSSLVGLWRKEKYLPIAYRMLESDPSWIARGSAAFALGRFPLRHGRERDPILRALARAVQGDASLRVVRDAFIGIVQLLDPERKTSTIPDLDFTRDDVDWKLIEAYLPN